MHLLYIIEADLSSGSGKCAIEFLKLLISHTKIKPIVVTQYKNSLNEECTKLNIENYAVHYARTCSLGMGYLGWLIAFLARPFLNFISYKKLKSIIIFNKIDLIHSNNSTIDFGAYLFRKTKIPHIWHIREFLVFERTLFPIVWNLPKYIEKYSSAIITVSKSLKEFIIKGGVKEEHVFAIYDGVSAEGFKQIDFNKSPQKLKMICLGNYDTIKGQDVVIEAVSMLSKQDLSQISIDFFGADNTNYKSFLIAKCKANHLENIINFYDYASNIPELLTKYDIGLQPSHTEGFSRVTVEYMLSSLCTIGNGNTAIKELIEHNKTGLLYNDGNIKEFSNLISCCIQNPSQVAKMGLAAQKDALENYCIENNFQKIVNVYNQLSGSQK
jgi:glycosyltransferase involved in cell wall biosynthesis